MLLNFLCFLSLCLSCFLSSKIESQKAEISRKNRDISVKGFWSNPGRNRQETEANIEVVPQEDLLNKPHNLIGQFDYTDNNNKEGWCTGFIAQNERLVVLAAHCLVNDDGTMTTDLKFYLPGPTNSTFKSFDIERVFYPPDFNASANRNNVNCTDDYAFAILSGSEGAGDYLHMQPRPSAMPAGLNLTNGQLVFTYGFLAKKGEVWPQLRRVRSYVSLEPKCKKNIDKCPYSSQNMIYIPFFHMWGGASGGPWIWYYGDESIEDVETHIVIGLLSLFTRNKVFNNEEYSISPKISEAFWLMMEDALAAIREGYPDSFV